MHELFIYSFIITTENYENREIKNIEHQLLLKETHKENQGHTETPRSSFPNQILYLMYLKCEKERLSSTNLCI